MTKYMRDLNQTYMIEILNSLGTSKKEIQVLRKITKDFDKLKSDLEDIFYSRLESMEDKKIIDKFQDAFYGKRNYKLVDKIIKEMKADYKMITKDKNK